MTQEEIDFLTKHGFKLKRTVANLGYEYPVYTLEVYASGRHFPIYDISIYQHCGNKFQIGWGEIHLGADTIKATYLMALQHQRNMIHTAQRNYKDIAKVNDQLMEKENNESSNS